MPKKLRPVYGYIKNVFLEFSTDRGALFAAAIAFFALISLVPLFLLAVGVFGYIIGSRENALNQVLVFAQTYVPVSVEQIEAYLIELSGESGVLSGIGFLGLLWTGSQVFVIIQQVMNIAIGSGKPLNYFRTRALGFALVIVAGALFGLSIGITSLLAALRHLEIPWLGYSMDHLELFWSIIELFTTTFISILAFTIVYHFSAGKNIGWTGPLIGGVTGGVLFEIAKYGFRWYVGNIVNFSAVYGPLGSVVVLVLWIYYVSVIAVFGAEVASVYIRRNRTE